MGNCFAKNKFISNQIKNEYKNKKVHISIIGNYKPKQVFKENCEIIQGLNSMCNCDIHISIGTNPTRIILSYIDIIDFNYNKGQTFHIYKIEYKEINNINDINQYDIYNSIQDYIYINKQEPKNDYYLAAI